MRGKNQHTSNTDLVQRRGREVREFEFKSCRDRRDIARFRAEFVFTDSRSRTSLLTPGASDDLCEDDYFLFKFQETLTFSRYFNTFTSNTFNTLIVTYNTFNKLLTLC